MTGWDLWSLPAGFALLRIAKKLMLLNLPDYDFDFR